MLHSGRVPKQTVRTLRGSAEEIRLVLESFLTSSVQPVLVEPGESPFPLTAGNHQIDQRDPFVMLSVWDDSRNLTRKVVGAEMVKPGRVELDIERFGKRIGRLTLVDLARPQNEHWQRRTDRMSWREHLRRALARQYPDWRIREITSEQDLEHSLSPVCTRAFLRRGTTGLAVIGAPDRDAAATALTFGLIWLDYLRRREPGCSIEGLAIFLPAGCENDTALRLRWLDPGLARYELWIVSQDGYEDRVDWLDTGNIDTRVEPRPEVEDVDAHPLASRVKGMAGVDTFDSPGGSSFRVRGLEFARLLNGRVLFGVDARHPASESDFAEIERLVEGLMELRNPFRTAAAMSNPLSQREPERWLEAIVRKQIDTIDASLLPSPVYGQVPAMAGTSRDVLDLVASTRDGRLAIVELKAGEDIHLPMQALDYWIRVRWHVQRGDFRANGYFPGIALRDDAPKLLLVAPALCLHPANETVLRFLSSDIEVEQVGVSVEWRKELRVVFRRTWQARRKNGIWPDQECAARDFEPESGGSPA